MKSRGPTVDLEDSQSIQHLVGHTYRIIYCLQLYKCAIMHYTINDIINERTISNSITINKRFRSESVAYCCCINSICVSCSCGCRNSSILLMFCFESVSCACIRYRQSCLRIGSWSSHRRLLLFPLLLIFVVMNAIPGLR